MDKNRALHPSSAGEKFIQVGNVKFRVIDEGPIDAPCVVFSHSIMTNADMWKIQAAFLKESFRVIRYDGRGHGKSTYSAGPYSMSLLANDVIGILDALAIGKVHFIGLSLGGIIGFDLALNHGDRMHSLVICDARADSPEEFARPWDARIETALQGGMNDLVEPTMARWFGPDFLRTALADDVRSMIRASSIEGFVATVRALQAYDYRSVCESAQVPLTLIAGERDGVLPSVMHSLAAQIKGAKFELIPSAGHLPNLENPESFKNALRRHFRSLDGNVGF
jgi:3-oxoadipate enol-lactonase